MRCEVVKSSEFESWWRELPVKLRNTVTAAVELLEEQGVDLPYPKSSGVEKSKHGHMRELRIGTRGEAIRVFYAFDPDRSIRTEGQSCWSAAGRGGRIAGSTAST